MLQILIDRSSRSPDADARTLLQFLCLYGAMLMMFAATARGWGPLHHDMTELWAWGKEFQLGYAKHPPFSAWLTGLWFSAMPRTNWSFYLLASLNIMAALAGVWKLASLFFGIRERLAAMLFLILVPSYSLWSLKFNVNAPLLSLWPWLTYCVLRSLETRRLGVSISAGLLGAAALLTKYYSLVLFAALLAAALLHPCRRRYFASAAPYVALMTGLVLVTPHVWWTIAAGFPTVDYAMSKTHYGVAEARASTIGAVRSSLGSLGLAFGAFGIAFGARSWPLLRRSIAATFDRRNAWLICLSHGPFLATMAAYFFANARITSGFLLPAFFAAPVVLLKVLGAEVTSAVLRRLAVCCAAIWLPLLAASPFLGYYTFVHTDALDAQPRRELAVGATGLWRAQFGRPLRYVTGEPRLATAATFYSPDTPSYLIMDGPSHSPWVSLEQANAEGVLVLCAEAAGDCIRSGTELAGANAVRSTQEYATAFLGRSAEPQRFVLIMRPPAALVPAK
jgi:4-amino-4-deoxy-L-arabinose transferase-like glycosyltransferase